MSENVKLFLNNVGKSSARKEDTSETDFECHQKNFSSKLLLSLLLFALTEPSVPQMKVTSSKERCWHNFPTFEAKQDLFSEKELATFFVQNKIEHFFDKK